MSACINAMRVLTDPAETGAVTLCLPQDVQGEAWDYPESFFTRRVHRLDRRPASAAQLADAVAAIKASRKPLIVCGGGVKYSGVLPSATACRLPKPRRVKAALSLRIRITWAASAKPAAWRRTCWRKRRIWSSVSARVSAISPPRQNGFSSTQACASSILTLATSTPGSWMASRCWRMLAKPSLPWTTPCPANPGRLAGASRLKACRAAS